MYILFYIIQLEEWVKNINAAVDKEINDIDAGHKKFGEVVENVKGSVTTLLNDLVFLIYLQLEKFVAKRKEFQGVLDHERDAILESFVTFEDKMYYYFYYLVLLI